MTLFTDKYGRKGWAFQIALCGMFILVGLSFLDGANDSMLIKGFETLLYLFGAFIFGNGFEHFTKKGKPEVPVVGS